ncbi:hypothetical protein JTB14_000095 [Gonioctena quinquepunctata]|nr:hypothetical protein JTB14_000095 [Gonioctena quinquepunctata]
MAKDRSSGGKDDWCLGRRHVCPAKTRCRRLTRLQLRMAECSNPNGRVCPLSRRGLCEGDTMSRARPTLDFS